MNNVIPFHYQGQPVRFNSEGWINATDVAKRFGKEPHEWLRLPETKGYLEAMAKTGIFPELTRTARGRAGGTWLHPKLAVAFARWLSPEFAVWADLQIDALLHSYEPARLRFDRACKVLDDAQKVASLSGKELAAWRWKRPGLVHEVEHWKNQLQMTLGLEVA